MNLLDAITTLLDATAEMEELPNIRQARKRLQQRAEALRTKRAKMAAPKCNCGALGHRGNMLKCKLPKGHDGMHECDGSKWERTNWETP